MLKYRHSLVSAELVFKCLNTLTNPEQWNKLQLVLPLQVTLALFSGGKTQNG